MSRENQKMVGGWCSRVSSIHFMLSLQDISTAEDIDSYLVALGNLKDRCVESAPKVFLLSDCPADCRIGRVIIELKRRRAKIISK